MHESISQELGNIIGKNLMLLLYRLGMTLYQNLLKFGNFINILNLGNFLKSQNLSNQIKKFGTIN
jgi:hypothetical protein